MLWCHWTPPLTGLHHLHEHKLLGFAAAGYWEYIYIYWWFCKPIMYILTSATEVNCSSKMNSSGIAALKYNETKSHSLARIWLNFDFMTLCARLHLTDFTVFHPLHSCKSWLGVEISEIICKMWIVFHFFFLLWWQAIKALINSKENLAVAANKLLAWIFLCDQKPSPWTDIKIHSWFHIQILCG